jgi:transposase
VTRSLYKQFSLSDPWSLMFINTMKQTKKDGTISWKVQLCVSERVGKKVTRKVVRHIGVAKRQDEVERFERIAAAVLESEIANRSSVTPLFSAPDEVEARFESKPRTYLSEEIVELQRTVEGPKEIYGSLFDELGFANLVPSEHRETLKNVVIARNVQPASKLKTREILERQLGFDVSIDKIYRMMNALSRNLDVLQKHVLSKTASLFENKIDVVFFDVTTLYFESVVADDIRDFGYSKDQKFHSTQVVLALATTNDGLPVGYKLFPGKTAETLTLVKCLEEWKKWIEIENVVFIADRGMFSASNLLTLRNSGYKFIVAAKMRQMNSSAKDKILSEDSYKCNIVGEDSIPTWHKVLDHNVTTRVKSQEGKWQEQSIEGRLICTYNRGRAAKDAHDREQILKKMRKVLGTEKETEKGESTRLVSNSGYKKYAKFEGKKLASINLAKVEEEEKWDGMHGIFTNSDLSVSEILQRYRGLWTIEETFRVSKKDLEMRPIYHFTKRRIETHIALCYLSLTLIRHLQQRLRKAGIKISPERIRIELSHVQSSELFDRANGKKYKLPSKVSPLASQIYAALGLERKLTLIKH